MILIKSSEEGGTSVGSGSGSAAGRTRAEVVEGRGRASSESESESSMELREEEEERGERGESASGGEEARRACSRETTLVRRVVVEVTEYKCVYLRRKA